MPKPSAAAALEELRIEIASVRAVTGEEHEEVRARLRNAEQRLTELETLVAELREAAAKAAAEAEARRAKARKAKARRKRAESTAEAAGEKTARQRAPAAADRSQPTG